MEQSNKRITGANSVGDDRNGMTENSKNCIVYSEIPLLLIK
jgi:hypothetical protein